MAEDGRFGDDGSIYQKLTPLERSFADVLRTRASTWPPESGYGTLLDDPCGAVLDIDDPARHLGLLTVGVYLIGDTLRGDKVHNQLFNLPDRPTPLALQATGSPEELAERAADWFEALLRRPIVRHEWLRSGQVYALCYVFADSGQALVEGRVRTGNLGTPDRTVPIRGELR